MHEFHPGFEPEYHPTENHCRLMIGKVASLYGITVQTLRHYDKIGLFRPEVINADTGYRYYSIEQLRQLEYILFLRRLDFSIPEIEEAMENIKKGGAITQVLEKRCMYLQKKIDDLQNLQKQLSTLTELAEKQKEPCNQIEIRNIQLPRYMRILQLDTPLAVADKNFTVKLMENRRELLDGIPTIQSAYSMGALISANELISNDVLAYKAVVLDPGLFGTKPDQEMEPIPAGYYACIRYHRAESKPETIFMKLIDFIKAHNFSHDDNILELGLDPSFSSISKLSELSELQIRIDFN